MRLLEEEENADKAKRGESEEQSAATTHPNESRSQLCKSIAIDCVLPRVCAGDGDVPMHSGRNVI